MIHAQDLLLAQYQNNFTGGSSLTIPGSCFGENLMELRNSGTGISIQ